jgi:small conductance mechanosensitive channel
MSIHRHRRSPNRYQPRWSCWQWRSFLCVAAATVALTVTPIASWAQAPGLLTPNSTASPQPTIVLPELDGFLTDKSSEIDRGAVRLDGRRLFLIAAPNDQSNGEENAETRSSPDPIDLRVQVIRDRLYRIVNSDFDPDTLEVRYELEGNSQLPVLYARYTADAAARDDELLTVTNLDAEIHATDAETLAQEWVQTVETALLRAQQERQPEFLGQQSIIAASTIVAVLVASWLIAGWQQRLAIEREALRTQLKAESQQISSATGEPGFDPGSHTALVQQHMVTQQRRGINDIQRRLFQFGQTLLWGGIVFFILGLFPYTRWLQPLILRWVQIPIKLGAIGFGTYLATRFSYVLVDRLLLVLQDDATPAPETSQRSSLRFSTFSRVGKSILSVVLVAIGIVVALSVIDIQVGPLLAGAGIVGLAVSFASQSLIKDMINGFFILLEDQYGVGDVIIVDDVAGAVENMNLRITQLRNEEGRLITIPNSAITIVQNLSKEWARVDLRVDVSYSADINQALQLIEQVAQAMSHERPWRDLILEPPLLLGVDELDYSGATVRLWIKTQPLKQWDVAREYRRRLKVAFDEAGISFGIPQQSLLLKNEDEAEFPRDSHLTTPRSGTQSPSTQSPGT